ncbi:MAG: copper resistance CopC family protein [Longimicrobiales bacterium]
MTNTIKAAAFSMLIIGGLAAASPAEEHTFALSRSAPEAGSSVETPSEIRLWFTEEPAEGTTQIRLLEAEDAGVHVMDVVQDEEDGQSFFIQLHGELSPGTYNVSWRGMGADGHVVRDTFEFTVVDR